MDKQKIAKLLAFSVMLWTDDETQFKKAYTVATKNKVNPDFLIGGDTFDRVAGIHYRKRKEAEK